MWSNLFMTRPTNQVGYLAKFAGKIGHISTYNLGESLIMGRKLLIHARFMPW